MPTPDRTLTWLTLALQVVATPAGAATYYVAGTGSDTNPGTVAAPLQTIQRAADLVRAGDTVVIAAGVYRERVVLRTSGAPGQPIVLRGERGTSGQWLTVIDPGQPVGTGWVTAPEIGPGVYKRSLGFVPAVMTLGGKHVARIADLNMTVDKGLTWLAYPATYREKTPGLQVEIAWWDGIQALYGTAGGVTYLRFADGRNPNGLDLRASAAGPALRIQNLAHIVVRDLHIRGAEQGVALEGSLAVDNVVEDNRITNGRQRLSLRRASRTLVRRNELSLDYYGYPDLGAWETGLANGVSSYHHAVREHLYRTFKFVIGTNSSDDSGVAVREGADNRVYENRISQGLIGVNTYATTRLSVHDNEIRNMSSVGVYYGEYSPDLRFHDNLLSDCNIGQRFGSINQPGDTTRSIYSYRNRSHNPPGVGLHLYFHFGSSTLPANASNPPVWLYQTSFAGGLGVLEISGYAAANGGIPGLRMLNNVFSAKNSYWELTSGVVTNASMIGQLDYSWLGGGYPRGPAAWFGPHCILASGAEMWSATTVPDFRLPAASAACHSGLDLSAPFTVGGATFPPLPGMTPGYFSGPAPHLGALQAGCGTADAGTADAGTADAGAPQDAGGSTPDSGEDAGSTLDAGSPTPGGVLLAFPTGGVLVDGLLDEPEWHEASPVTFGDPDEESENQVSVRALWNAQELSLAFEVSDSQVEQAGGRPWRDDGVELFLDPQGQGGTQLQPDDVHLVVSTAGTVYFGRGTGSGESELKPLPAGLAHAARTTSSGYVVELTIPWSELGATPSPSLRLGALFAVNDVEGARWIPFGWLDATWTRPDEWGVLELRGALSVDGGSKDAGHEADGGPGEEPPADAGEVEVPATVAGGCGCGAGGAAGLLGLGLLLALLATGRPAPRRRCCRPRR